MSPARGGGEARRAAVVTGTSTGIGRAAALWLDALGWRVFAGVRRAEDGEALRATASEQLEPLLLDVTDAGSVRAAAERVAEAVGEGGLSGLVNNAGVTRPAPLEFIDPLHLRDQLEVNVVGQVVVTQAFLPLLRAAPGRVVYVSSMGGYVASPMLGAYCASKFAIEALADTLRLELRGSGVSVSIIEPGSVETAIWDKGVRYAQDLAARLPRRANELYADAIAAVVESTRRTAARGIPPEAVARAVEHALLAPRPRTRYQVGIDARLARVASRVLPARWMDWLVIRNAGLHRLSPARRPQPQARRG